jgi:hypothetical protein
MIKTNLICKNCLNKILKEDILGYWKKGYCDVGCMMSHFEYRLKKVEDYLGDELR